MEEFPWVFFSGSFLREVESFTFVCILCSYKILVPFLLSLFPLSAKHWVAFEPLCLDK